MEQESPDIRINEFVTDVEITEGVGPLSAAELKKIVALVLEHVRNEQYRSEQRSRDTQINDRVFQPNTRIC
jgi:hypothetical protein